jgi:hypothetical protein
MTAFSGLILLIDVPIEIISCELGKPQRCRMKSGIQ